MGERAELDFYPTPPACVRALYLWLLARDDAEGPWFEPCAGAGAMIQWMPKLGPWSANDLDPSHQKTLAELCESVTVGDALAIDWPDIHAGTNPPFSASTPFLQRMAAHARSRERYGIVLCRTSAWQTSERRHVPLPDFILGFTWRPRFTAKGSGYFQDMCWSVWTPEPTGRCTFVRLDRPRVPRRHLEEHARMLGLQTEESSGQLFLFDALAENVEAGPPSDERPGQDPHPGD